MNQARDWIATTARAERPLQRPVQVSANTYDILIVGGGIVGVATALALVESRRLRLGVVEAEPGLAAHQSGRNSGVIHSGLYYRPGSLKARLCSEGREAMFDFCRRHSIPHEQCGKLVVATRQDELPRLAELERRGRANGLAGLERLGPTAMREREPNVSGIGGLWVPQTGIVDFGRVTEVMAGLVRAAGGDILTGRRVVGVQAPRDEIVLETSGGELRARRLVGCAGLHADRLARRCGLDPRVRIVPFRGEYYALREGRRDLVRGLIYPVPDPRFPFLGVHFTRRVDGRVEAGPNAVLALAREGYGWRDVSPRHLAALAADPAVWRMAARYGAVGVGEMARSLSKRLFVRALRRLVPGIECADLVPGGSGVRAQAVGGDGGLLDDFAIVETPRMIHVLNAPSPGATASLAIGRWIAGLAAERLAIP
jgi:L-2-hydroxyglutarate oxidase